MENKLYEAASRLPETNLDFDAIQPAKKPTAIKTIRWAASLAACAALLIGIGFGTHAVVAEAKEYNAAVRFFDEYDLSTEGLSRSQIKAVYRDIITESFTYSKTAGVILRNLSAEEIKGYEIDQREPTPEDMENIWNYRKFSSNYQHAGSVGPTNIRYERGKELYEGELFIQRSIKKYVDDTLVWEVAITDFILNGYTAVSDGVIVYGHTSRYQAPQNEDGAWLAKIDSDGKILWTHKLYNDYGLIEEVAAVLENADGTYTVVSRGDYDYFYFRRLNADGIQIYCRHTLMGNYGIWNVVPFRDGYLVQLGNMDNFAKIVVVDQDGRFSGTFSYDGQDTAYYITDMIEYNGNIYLSAYSVPKLGEESISGRQDETAKIMDYVIENGYIEVSEEGLTAVVRDHYTALLLVCDPETGIPDTFFSIKGSLGNELSISSTGQLLWDVESITSVRYNPWSSFATFRGLSSIFRYTFAENGLLISQADTGKTIPFAK